MDKDIVIQDEQLGECLRYLRLHQRDQDGIYRTEREIAEELGVSEDKLLLMLAEWNASGILDRARRSLAFSTEIQVELAIDEAIAQLPNMIRKLAIDAQEAQPNRAQEAFNILYKYFLVKRVNDLFQNETPSIEEIQYVQQAGKFDPTDV